MALLTTTALALLTTKSNETKENTLRPYSFEFMIFSDTNESSDSSKIVPRIQHPIPPDPPLKSQMYRACYHSPPSTPSSDAAAVSTRLPAAHPATGVHWAPSFARALPHTDTLVTEFIQYVAPETGST